MWEELVVYAKSFNLTDGVMAQQICCMHIFFPSEVGTVTLSESWTQQELCTPRKKDWSLLLVFGRVYVIK